VLTNTRSLENAANILLAVSSAREPSSIGARVGSASHGITVADSPKRARGPHGGRGKWTGRQSSYALP